MISILSDSIKNGKRTISYLYSLYTLMTVSIIEVHAVLSHGDDVMGIF